LALSGHENFAKALEKKKLRWWEQGRYEVRWRPGQEASVTQDATPTGWHRNVP